MPRVAYILAVSRRTYPKPSPLLARAYYFRSRRKSNLLRWPTKNARRFIRTSTAATLYSRFSAKIGGIVVDMAHLREQARLIQEIVDFHKNGGVSPSDHRNNIALFFGAVNEVSLLGHLYERPALIHDEPTFKAPPSDTKEGKDRRNRIGLLFRSCQDDNFLTREVVDIGNKKPERQDVILFDVGVRVTSRGSDLLTWMGFWSVAFEKHSKFIVFLWGAIAAVIGSVVVWTITNINIIIRLFNGLKSS